ncbi:hypothetical protein C0Q70_11686 [Pomacea canaliculata]|uniref:Dynein light chain Tctex-type 1 n=1 Tax=Pomacea canaliculata TaxID=400727 RepID=A0A2T7P6Q7_POMCA|nr:hypothetical protein C0Q70_11686 [Pomacea canaliculata]
MDEFQSGEETAFVVDEVTNIIKEAIEGAIGGNAYQHNKVNQWTSSVVEQCLNQLTKLGKPFKYIVTCVIMQKNGAGLHTASSCYWDNATDDTLDHLQKEYQEMEGSMSAHKGKEENRTDLEQSRPS